MITTQYMTSFTPEEMQRLVEQGNAKDARIAELEELVRDVAAIIGAGADTSSGGYWIDGDEREATVIDRLFKEAGR